MLFEWENMALTKRKTSIRKKQMATEFKNTDCNTNWNSTVVHRSYTTPNYAIFAATLFWIGSKKIRVKLFSSFFPQLRYFLSPQLDSIAQDIYYIKQTPSCAFFAITLFRNSAGNLLHKTNPDLSYFELSYVFWEHIDSVGRGTTVYK